MKPLIYSVEDDQNIQNVIKIALNNANFETFLFDDAKSLFKALENKTPDLILLDVMLPGDDGFDIIKKLKSNPLFIDIPIMIISARTSEIDRVIGLNTGADDYLVKPFGVLELVSRVKALLRRSKLSYSKDRLIIDDLVMDIKNYSCTYQKQALTLTKKQFDLLKLLMENNHSLVSRDEILNVVWGFNYIGETRTIDVHIKEIRKKLREAGLQNNPIETVRGIGYKMVL